MRNSVEAKKEAPPKYPTRLAKHWFPMDVFWMTAEEYAAMFVCTWETVPQDRADAFLGCGVRRQVTKEMAYESYLVMAEIAIESGSAIPVETVELHKLKLPRGKGYVRDGDFYIIPKCKTKKQAPPKSHCSRKA